jgi:hypothetical protein
VTLPKPEPGLVIGYSYLWHREFLEGHEEGSKDRPCAIVLAVSDREFGERTVVVPITHTKPVATAMGMELPQIVKRHLGLDSERSWIVYTESNVFRWPGPDLRRLPNRDNESVAYGFLPPRLFAELCRRFAENERVSARKRVIRTE